MKKKRRIPEPQLPAPKALKFSFKYFEADHPKYGIVNCDAVFLRSLLETLGRYSGFTIDDFRDQNNDESRHAIYFPATTEPEGFVSLDPDTLRLVEPWQFPVCPGEHIPPKSGWRVYGFLLEDIFYIVWIDAGHQLYPDAHPKLIRPPRDPTPISN